MKKDYDLFSAEKQLIDHYTDFLESGSTVVPEDLQKILQAYKKLFKNTKRLVKMSDKNEKELNELNAQMKEKNALLEVLSEKLSRYISPQLAQSILENQEEAELETKRKKLTVFFSDIIGFSSIADRLESEELAYHLNTYLDEMTQVALEFGATVDKYIGDSLMVFFGDPVSKGVKEDALLCVEMALEMRKRLRSLVDAGTILSFQTRIGINTGYCTVGNFGSQKRMDYTVIGKEVNIASRLEGVAREGEILISDETYQLVKDFIECSDGKVYELKGISHPVKAYSAKRKRSAKEKSEDIISAELFHGNASIRIDPSKLIDEEKKTLLTVLHDISSKLKAGASE